MRRKLTHILAACFGTALLALAFLAGPAAAGKPPCWKTLINDWYDGRIDGTYPIPCYRDALKHLPTDVETYSSARDDIKQALQARILQGKQGGTSGAAGGGKNGSGGGPAGSGGGKNGGGKNGGGKNGGGNGHGKGADTVPPGTSKSQPGGREPGGGVVGNAIKSIGPSKADSVPIPLVVLGAVALLLMAAGAAGFTARRIRTRRLQLASAASIPQRPAEPPAAGK